MLNLEAMDLQKRGYKPMGDDGRSHNALLILYKLTKKTLSIMIPYDGSYQECLFDAEDFNRINQFRLNIKPNYTTTYIYAVRPGNKWLFLHRYLMKLGPTEFVIHKNGNGLDNRKANLKICTKAELFKHNKGIAI